MVSPLFNEITISIGSLGVAGWAGWLDWRSRRIPNWLTLPAMFAGVAVGAVARGWPGTVAALEGAGVALGALLPFVLARGLGAGDWKLMGALGAFLGPQQTLVVLLGTIMITGMMAVYSMIQQKKVKETAINLWILIVAYSTFRVASAREISLDNPALTKLPFGVAAAVATLMFFCTVATLRFF